MKSDTHGSFQRRHIGPDSASRDRMLRAIGVPSLDALIDQTIPPGIRSTGRLDLPDWRVYFKGGWGAGTGAVDHQVVLLRRGEERIAVAVLTANNGSHAAGKTTLEGVFRRLLRDLE